MLQSDDDRWPMWDKEYEDDQLGNEDDRRTSEQASDGPTENKKLTNERRQVYTPKSSPADAWRYASLGTELFAAVLIGTFLGWVVSLLVKRLTGYEPTWVIAIGVFIGAAAGFLNLYGVIVEEEKKEEQNKRGSSR